MSSKNNNHEAEKYVRSLSYDELLGCLESARLEMIKIREDNEEYRRLVDLVLMVGAELDKRGKK